MPLKTQVVMDGVVWLVALVSVCEGGGGVWRKVDRQINYENHMWLLSL